jgi:small ligand-binding sensory domain FIST
MGPFAFAVAQGGDPRALVEDLLARLPPLPEGATLGFLYATEALAPELERVVRLLRAATGASRWVGTVGAGIVAGAREVYETPALAVMLTDLPESAFRILSPGAVSVEGFLDTQRAWLQRRALNVGVIHADPTDPLTPSLLQNLENGVPGPFLVGGLSSGRAAGLQVAGTVGQGGVSGVFLDPEQVPVTVDHTQGCTPMGETYRVTACDRNIVAELDGRPALDVMREAIGEVLARDLQRAAGFIFAGFPVPGSDTGDYLVRNLLGVDPGQGLIAVGDRVSPGQRMMFCRRDGNSAREDLDRMLERVRARLPGPPRGALYFSCLGRGRNQFGPDSEEARTIAEALGPDVPLLGFFCNGEIYANRLYGYTGVLTVFS